MVFHKSDSIYFAYIKFCQLRKNIYLVTHMICENGKISAISDFCNLNMSTFD